MVIAEGSPEDIARTAARGVMDMLFFGDTGCRILPATPGRTTMWLPPSAPLAAGVAISRSSVGEKIRVGG